MPVVTMSSGLTIENIREIYGPFRDFCKFLNGLQPDVIGKVLNLTTSRKLFGDEVGLQVFAHDQKAFTKWLMAFSEAMGSGTAQSFDDEEFQEAAQELWDNARR